MQVPIFLEPLPHLREVFEEAAPGTAFVITRCRAATQNLRTHLERIIKKAGLTPWLKLWHNLRAARETELAETFLIHVVTGREPLARNPEKTANLPNRRAKSDVSKAARGFARPPDADLQRVVEAWPNLPAHVRQTIVTLIEAANPRRKPDERTARQEPIA